MSSTSPGAGPLLKEWRGRRRRSQLELAIEAGVSTKHLSFVETGRAKPSRELLLTLARHLDVPLRDRNSMLLAAGYAPRYHETPIDTFDVGSITTPFGGFKESGTGRDRSMHAVAGYTRLKTTYLQL